MEQIENVLAQRYASKSMKEIWSPEGRILMERDLWISVLKAQKELGLPIDDDVISSYEKVKNHVDLQSIKNREKLTRHDVKSRIEEFCDLAGYEHIHKGMTSRDLTENVEQLQVFKSLQFIRSKAVTALIRLSEKADFYRNQIITQRFLDFFIYGLIGLTKKLATLRMPNDYILTTNRGKHTGGNLACESAAVFPVYILSAEPNGCSLDNLMNGVQICKWGA